MSRALLLSSLLFLGVGCAGAGAGLRAEGPSIRMGQRSAEPMVVTNRHITGPSSSLVLHEEGMTLALASYTETYSPTVSMARFTTPRELTRHVPATYCRKFQ